MDNQNTQNTQQAQATQIQNIDGQEYEIIGGVACPVDPAERLLCDSCQ